ncbi:PCI domain-containing protein [Xylariomycetidae sp. FL2044]|nr:PCI domain-containing protein [Xylariomycetidae sp. FL2044]
MDSLIREFNIAYHAGNGDQLGETVHPDLTRYGARMKNAWANGNERSVKEDLKYLFYQDQGRVRLSKVEAEGWESLYLAYWTALGEILAAEGLRHDAKSSWSKVYYAWMDFTLRVIRGYTNHEFPNFTLPCLYVAGKYLRLYAMRADADKDNGPDDTAMTGFQDDFDPEAEENKHLEDCSRHINRMFQICLQDRNPVLQESRKWGVYAAANLLFKTHFKLNKTSLCKTILNSLSAGRTIMPPISSFPMSQQVTCKYYEGVLQFLEENYEQAETHLTYALSNCHRDVKRNFELILTYLIPCTLITKHKLPSTKLLEPYPRLQKLFLPLAHAIKKGDLRAFDAALLEGEDEFTKRRIYLTLERGRDVALRNLLIKVFIAAGFEDSKDGTPSTLRRTRIPIVNFEAAIKISSGMEKVDTDEILSLMASLIYKGLMKGYISLEHNMVVLSKTGAFPGTKY